MAEFAEIRHKGTGQGLGIFFLQDEAGGTEGRPFIIIIKGQNHLSMMGDSCTEDKTKTLIINSENHLNFVKTKPKNPCWASTCQTLPEEDLVFRPSPNRTPVEGGDQSTYIWLLSQA